MADDDGSVLERGTVSFLFQAKVDTPFPENLDDIQRTFMLLRRDGSDTYRRLRVGPKRLSKGRGRFAKAWCAIDRVGPLPRVLGGLEPSTYLTKTRGERFQPGARYLCTGRYAIVTHEDHAHFTYEIAPDVRLGEIHEALAIQRHASFRLVGMRPYAGQQGSMRWQKFPPEVQAHFGERRFAPPIPAMLELDGMNLLLMSTGHDVEVDLGVDDESPVDEALHAWMDKWQLRALPELPPELSP